MKIKKGDRVYYKAFNLIGRVRMMRSGGLCLVEFKGWGGGHDGNGYLPRSNSKDFWIICDFNLKVLEPFSSILVDDPELREAFV